VAEQPIKVDFHTLSEHVKAAKTQNTTLVEAIFIYLRVGTHIKNGAVRIAIFRAWRAQNQW